LKISEVLGTDLFRNYSYLLTLFFLISVAVILALFYLIVLYFEYRNFYIIIPLFILLSLLLGYTLSRLSIEPLKEYMDDLTSFSKETLHELNIPIATIKMNAQLLEKSLIDAKHLKRLGRINDATQMLELRYKELDYLIKKQAFIDVVEEVNLESLVRERVENLSQLFSHVEFRVNLEKFSLKVDKIGLIKVLDNIIENAIKYSTKPVVIEIELKNSTLRIKDSGIGMDEVTLLKIFDGFYQEDREAQGYGIGLKVVKRYCDSNKIALHVTSKLNSGTCVSLNFKGKEIGYS